MPNPIPPILEADQVTVTLQKTSSVIVVQSSDQKSSVEIGQGLLQVKSPDLTATLGANMFIAKSFGFFGGTLGLGGNGQAGAFMVRPKEQTWGFVPFPSPKAPVSLTGDAKLSLGGSGYDGNIQCLDKTGKLRIEIDGNTGDIKLAGADCAENFCLRGAQSVAPGTVLVIIDEEGLEPCAAAYDSRVAGVVSGAGDLQPGIRLDSEGSLLGRAPVALVGKVNCLVDATYGSIEIGDLLTTSMTTGHAMVARDRDRRGCILGKALRGLSNGRGLIPVLVTLQ